MLALLLPASASAEPTARIIVKRDAGLSAAEQRHIRSDAGATLVERLDVPRLEVVEVPRSDLASALRTLRRDPDVAVAEPDATYRELAPADPYMDMLWGFENTGPPQVAYRLPDDGGPPEEYDPLAGADMSVLDGWAANLALDRPSLGRGHTIAVIDSGTEADQQDLAGRVADGYDFVDEDADAADSRGHGTEVAGIIAATRENGVGAAGVAPESRILPLRIIGNNGTATAADIIDAVHFAGEQGIRVVNASFGSPTASELLRHEIETHPNTLFVAAAGNDGADNDVTPTYPCAYEAANVLCVGATDALDEKPDWSNYGSDSVDVYAPGEGIFTTGIGAVNAYVLASGTSMSAPHIAGLAALLLSRNPSLTSPELKDAILSTADLPAGLSALSGKRANAEAALTAVPADRDGDRVNDVDDNCPDVKNLAQLDDDSDGVGNLCDPDANPDAPDWDGDGVLDVDDECATEAGTASNGCPGKAEDSNHDGLPDMFDTDDDGVRNASDNCPALATTDLTDSDHDGVGNACDPTPRGPDADGDGVAALDDACPNQKAFTANGCPVQVTPTPTPTPTPAPSPIDSDHDGIRNTSDGCPFEYALTNDGCPLPTVTSLSARAKKRGGKRSATISVRASRTASVMVTIERKVCKHKRCHWKRVTRKRATTVGGRATVTATKLKRGSYRAIVVLESSAGRAKAETQRFRVR